MALTDSQEAQLRRSIELSNELMTSSTRQVFDAATGRQMDGELLQVQEDIVDELKGNAGLASAVAVVLASYLAGVVVNVEHQFLVPHSVIVGNICGAIDHQVDQVQDADMPEPLRLYWERLLGG